MKVKKTGLITICFLFGISFLSAQESINASGGVATGSGGSVSYSVGQLTYNTYTGSNGTITQGVQQSFEISETLSVDNTAILLEASIFPNPTTDYLNLRLKDTNVSELSFQIIDITGKLITTKKLVTSNTIIQMDYLPATTYFMTVFRNQKTIKTFKIIKN
jgi:hypothetical protein